MSVGKVSQEWKRALVTPDYKSGPALSMTNYRPISLTCVACKLMERVIVNETLCFFRRYTANSLWFLVLSFYNEQLT